MPDGRTELFWDHQLEETKQSFPRDKRRWGFWQRIVGVDAREGSSGMGKRTRRRHHDHIPLIRGKDEEVFGMEIEKRVLQTGSRVRVHEAHNSYLRGRVGTIKRHHGDIDYAVFEVRFDDGRYELFWHYELLEAAEE